MAAIALKCCQRFRRTEFEHRQTCILTLLHLIDRNLSMPGTHYLARFSSRLRLRSSTSVDCPSPLNSQGMAADIRKQGAIGYRQQATGDSGNRSCRSSKIAMLGAWILS
jgi:hypothetical protein